MPRFGDLEAAIMDQVWRADGPVLVREVVDGIRQDRPIAFTTVQTVMEILFRKGWLTRDKDGRAYRYAAASPREEYTAQLLSEALETTSDRGAAFSRLFDRMAPGEVAELRDALAKAKRRAARKASSR
jgi:predicted transcriptional regulator